MHRTCNCEDFPCCGHGIEDETEITPRYTGYVWGDDDYEVCENCGEPLDEWCDVCGLCPDCCTCD